MPKRRDKRSNPDGEAIGDWEIIKSAKLELRSITLGSTSPISQHILEMSQICNIFRCDFMTFLRSAAHNLTAMMLLKR